MIKLLKIQKNLTSFVDNSSEIFIEYFQTLPVGAYAGSEARALALTVLQEIYTPEMSPTSQN